MTTDIATPPSRPVPVERDAEHAGSSMWRADIQGLRAIAVVMVVVYHVWPTVMSGGFVGVDVFFVISGFLISGLLLRQPPRSAGDLVEFWARRVRRLLPASLLVLICSLVGVLAVAPDSQWRANAREAISSALYFENWQLVSASVDYLRADDPPTVFQHFWSLSVEEQFYVFWPLLVLAIAVLSRRTRLPTSVAASGGMALIVISSFLLSARLTVSSPTTAYFSTPVRAWEFGLGGLLAVVVRFRGSGEPPAPRVRSILGWCGLVAIVGSAFSLRDSTAFPGWIAAVPVLGCVAVIAAESTSKSTGLGWLLSRKPALFLGDISYSLYLWHWPLIILLPYISGQRLGALDRAAVVLGSVVLAALTKTFVEDPLRRRRSLVGAHPFQFAAAGMLVVAAVSFGVFHEVDGRRAEARRAVAAAEESGGECFGAGALDRGVETCPPVARDQIVPAPAEAAEDRTTAYADNCFNYRPFPDMTTCFYGDPGASRSIALVGNSHAGHWLTTLQSLMVDEDFNLTTYIASNCNITTTRMKWEPASDGAACLEWAGRVIDETLSGRFDLVVTAAIQIPLPLGSDNPEQAYEMARVGHVEALNTWIENGVNVLVIRDTPRTPSGFGTVPDCVAVRSDPVAACSGPRAEWIRPDPLYDAAVEVAGRYVSAADLTELFCTVDTCFGVVGGVITLYDEHHITATFGRTMAPYLRGPLHDALDSAA
jgi:peptidoglycan/LPS O-acetylase OafA/YrhL